MKTILLLIFISIFSSCEKGPGSALLSCTEADIKQARRSCENAKEKYEKIVRVVAKIHADAKALKEACNTRCYKSNLN